MPKDEKMVCVGCGALIVNDHSEVLLIKRTSKTHNEAGFWNQPGGGVEFGETVEKSIRREIKEELGVDIKLIKYLCYTDQILTKEKQHWIAISYLAKITKGRLRNLEPHKHSEIRWFAIDKLPSKLAQTTKDSVRAYLAL